MDPVKGFLAQYSKGSTGRILILPLPPSVNRLYVWNKYIHQKVYKREGKEYLTENELVVRKFMKDHRLETFSDYIYLDLYFILPRTNADSHNYKKLLFDVLEHGGLITNDKFIMDRTQAIGFDPKNPRVVILLP